MIWLLVVAVVGLLLLSLLVDLNHRDLARTNAMAEAALRRAQKDP